MNNRERSHKTDSLGMYICILRKKENDRRNKELCFRQIIKDENDLAILKARVSKIPGVWRIYQQINKRAVRPARILLMKVLVDEKEAVKFDYRLDSLWKNCLLQPICKAEKNFMLDIDCNWNKDLIDWFIEHYEFDVSEIIRTPNGWHIIMKSCDTRKLEGLPHIEVKRDAAKFVERFTIKLTNEEYFDRIIKLKEYYDTLSLNDFEEQYIKQKHKDLLNERDMCIDQIKKDIPTTFNDSLIGIIQKNSADLYNDFIKQLEEII